MPDTPFVHLHCHSDYSLLDGACEIGQLLDAAAAQNAPAIALTDHGNLFGAVHFHKAAAAAGIKPIIGCEVYVAQDHKRRVEGYNHLVLLCENQEGYRNLIDLVSTAYLEGFYYKPRIDRDLLARHSKGLIALSGCLKGEINEKLYAGQYDEARRVAYTYNDIFGRGNFFIEIQDHGMERDRKVVPLNIRLSQETGIPLVATNDAHYIRREDARSHEVMLCIQTGKTMSDETRMKWPEELFLKNRDEMLALFGEVGDAVDRPLEIAARCSVKLDRVPSPFPRFDVPQGHTTDTYFEYVARQGFEGRLPRLRALAAAGRLKHSLEEYAERLDREISIIQQMKFAGYFLIVWDFIRFSRDHKIPVGPGRGSAAGSLVSYSMGITDIDPLQYGLLFERFLNPERVSMPDIDIDFCTRRRGEVIQYVTNKYGREQVAQIITIGTLGARAAIKDVGRVLDMSYADVDRLTKLIPNVLNIKLADAIKAEPAISAAARQNPKIAEVLDVAQRLEGLARNAGVHAAGVVIAPQPLKEVVPLYRTNKDEIVTQYDMSGLEKLGLLKMDFLGLTTLTLVHDAIELIARHRGVQIVMEEIPLDDPATYDIFCKAFTSGIFQFESAGMRDILRRYQPSRIEDLCALNALYRPGPIQGGMVSDFIERKHGRTPVTYELPDLQPILEETYGVIVYQEQVMQIANRLAGYSLGEADLLRRAMGKKKAEEMEKQRQRFREGAAERGYPIKKIDRIFELMAQFAGYGFNKSHSAAYAYLAYVTAYLKAHYPVDFMAALLTSETGNTAKVVKYINECRDMGIRVLPPDVNSSEWSFTPDGDAIRFGLGAIKSLGSSAVDSIIKARGEGGRFRSLYDFCERVDLASLNRRMIESLIKAGAMDSLGPARSQLFAAVETAIESGQKVWRDRMSGQAGLFAAMGVEPAPEPPLPELPEYSLREKLAFEKEVLGFYVTGHPLEEYLDKIKELSTHTIDELDGLERGAEVSLCGILTNVQRRRNKEGKPWAAMQFEDLGGTLEAVLFTTNYERLMPIVSEECPVLVSATVLPEEGAPPKLSIQDLVPLEVAGVSYPSFISIRVPLNRSDGIAAALSHLVKSKPGETSVRLRLEAPRDFSLTLDLAERVRPDREFEAEIARLCGPDAIERLG